MLTIAFLMAGCAGGYSTSVSDPTAVAERASRTETQESPSPSAPTPEGGAEVDPELINRRVTDFEARLPPRLLGRDSIRPVYDPQFAAAAQAPLEDDELVIGIELEGEAKAYPITVLRIREMVNDELAGWPILVTW